jgi:sterol desaturase/sphingolipid hydroxylase (fatty acid hydroxylase superfamily)
MNWNSLLSTGVVLSVIIVARYFAVAGLFYWLLWKCTSNPLNARKLTDITPPRKLILSEIRWSVIASVIYAVPAVVVIEAWKMGNTALYSEVGKFGWPYLLLSIFVYLFIHDTYFYWTHRLMHQPAIFRVVHRVHHESRQPTPWAGFSFHPWESIIGAIILPILVFFIPIHIGAILFILVLMTVVSVTNHSGYEIMPDAWLKSFGGRHWISAAHHNLHHLNYQCNFALYFRFWDKLMGTDELESAYDFLQKNQERWQTNTIQ